MSKEAMKLALETLEVWKGYMPALWDKTDEKAIIALRQALTNEALDKMAENARELGLDYEPAQQEPVAWMHKVTKLMINTDEIAKTSRNEERINSGEFQPLYTSPQPAPVQQEPINPFAWANTDDLCADTAFRWCEIGNHKTPLYTSPPAQRKPLTDEQILNFGPGQPDAVWSYEDQLYFARAIEAAHGIKENT